MEQRRIGSVQPFCGYTEWHFIAGACLKYCDNPAFEDSLIEFIENKLSKIKNKKKYE